MAGRRATRLEQALARLSERRARLLDALEQPARPADAAARRRTLVAVEQLIVEYECLRAGWDHLGTGQVGPTAGEQGQPAGFPPARG